MSEYHYGVSMRRALRRMLSFVCILTLALNVLSIPARAQEGAEVEDLILAVNYPPYTLSNGMLAVQRGESFYLPFVELAEMFEFFLEEKPEDGSLRGYFKEEANSFAIDRQKGEYEVRGSRKPLPPDAVIDDPFSDGAGEVFVRLDVLNDMWPVKLSVNLSGLVLLVESAEKLPFLVKIEREDARKISLARKAYEPSKEKLPFKDNPYKFVGLPAVDFDTSYKWDHTNKIMTGATTVAGLQDLAWATADYSVTSSYDQGRFHRPDVIRLRLTKQSFGDETLGLGVREVQGGDVRIDHRPLVANSSGGRGAVASSYPPQKDNEFDRMTVEGTGIVGWEVELYRNDILEAFSTVDAAGEYRFENVPLTIGNNQVRVVLYGPQGQVQERIENYQIGGGMSKPGTTDYTVGLVDADRPLIMITGGERTQPRGMAGNVYVAHGLNKEVTVFGSASKLPTQEDEEKKYASAGVMATFLNSFGQAEFFKESNGGHAVDLRLATKIMGLRLNLQSAFFRNFSSPDAGFDANAKTYEGEARVSTNLKTPVGNLGLQFATRHTETKSGLPQTSVDLQQTMGMSGLHLSNQTNTQLSNYIHQTSTGSLSATVRLRQWQFRGGLDYNIYPRRDLGAINGEARYTDKDGFSAAVNAQHNFLTRAQSAGVQLGYDFGKVLGSVDLNWIKEGGVNMTLRASTSLGPYGRNGKYIVDSQKLSRNTPVQGHVFLDRDGDSVFGEGDEPVPEARLLVGGGGSNDSGDDDGYVVAQGGSGGEIVNVEINKSSLIDPYYQPGSPGYSTVLRPGSMPMFEFPVIETGAIDGTVLREDGSPISGMRLELVDEGGAVVMTAESAYDGFYTFEFVPPGTYVVRADPSYGVNVPPETVTVASDDLFSSGIDLQLLEQAEGAEAADEVEEGDEPASTDEAESESGRVAHTYHERSNGTLQPAPLSTGGELSALVKRVRIGEHPDKVRLVLDLSDPIVYRMGYADGGRTLNIDLPGVGWNAIRNWRGATTPAIESFEVQALSEGGTRLIIHGRNVLASGLNGVLEPQNGQGHRLFIDLMEK